MDARKVRLIAPADRGGRHSEDVKEVTPLLKRSLFSDGNVFFLDTNLFKGVRRRH